MTKRNSRMNSLFLYEKQGAPSIYKIEHQRDYIKVSLHEPTNKSSAWIKVNNAINKTYLLYNQNHFDHFSVIFKWY